MPSSPSIESLALRRADIANQISALGDLRSGSITTTFGRCGKPNCHGHQSENAGHGPNLRLTDQADGKTVTVSLPDPIAVRKADREIAEFRQLQNLHKQFVEVNARICQLRPAETEATEAMETQEKNGGRDPSRNRPLDAGRFPRSPPDRPARPSSRGDGDALGHARHAPCRSSGDIPIAAVRSSAPPNGHWPVPAATTPFTGSYTPRRFSRLSVRQKYLALISYARIATTVSFPPTWSWMSRTPEFLSRQSRNVPSLAK